MKRLCYLLMLLGLACTTSCIEEYNELPDGAEERMLVIEGQIVSESECRFSLRYSASLDEEAYLARQVVSGAQVMVVGSDGECFPGMEIVADPGHYVVQVGKLNPEVSYSLRIHTSVGSYSSRPMLPLDAPAITEFCFEQPREDRMIDFFVSTDDTHQLAYYRWEYRETWEIFTPYKGLWTYVFDNQREFEQWRPDIEDMPVPAGHYEMVARADLKDHGWSKFDNRESLFSSNADYGQGAIRRLCLYQRHPDDNRYQTRYLSQVRQMAITAEEYEYLHLMSTQSTEMGGLFTPMPSELPGNVTGLDGEHAIGFVGVRGHVAEAELYINRSEVGHKDLYRVEIVPDSLVEEPPYMLKKGYKVIDYDQYMNEVKWSDRWVIDCTDPFWMASQERPEYWKDENNE